MRPASRKRPNDLVAIFLVSDAAATLTGNIEYIDAGYDILG
jgi:enoyl-[acyl-carrier-protein] reductase (NADH)